MKLVDVLDSKSCVGNHVPVRVRPSANKKDISLRYLFYLWQIILFLRFHKYMKINKFNYSPILYNKISFGTTGRYYKSENGDEFGTNSWLFRDDIEWKTLARYEKNHFCNKNRVNIIQFASSDGSEAYTTIISLLENFPQKNAEKFFPIKAYDIDEEIVNAARSGYINTCLLDRINLQVNSDDYSKYFTDTKEILNIKRDVKLQNQKTLKASNILKNRVHFERADMYNILANLNDNSDTVLMCRNVLGYFENDRVEKFVKIVSNKLKQGSLFIIGEHDTTNSFIDRYLKENKFMYVFKHVYQKL